MNEPTRVFKPHLWSAYKRWFLPLGVIPLWAFVANIDHLTIPTFWQDGFLVIVGFALVAMVIPALRLLLMKHRIIKIGPDWICGPTEELFIARRVCTHDIEEVEETDPGKRVEVRSNKRFSIVVILKDYNPKQQNELLQLVLGFQNTQIQ